ncbi:hypothetical protein C0995_007491 [Termitomyces sp. Mi166|nr:hypothetical protein C0995_007491 [Termitomyces sp. Mi166\
MKGGRKKRRKQKKDLIVGTIIVDVEEQTVPKFACELDGCDVMEAMVSWEYESVNMKSSGLAMAKTSAYAVFDLQADLYNCTKLFNILMTAMLMTKTSELKNVALAIAFLLDTNVTDYILDILAEAIVVKVLGCLKEIAEKLGSIAKYLIANNVKHAETTLVLKATSDTLEGVSISLGAIASNLASSPPMLTSTTLPTWATITKATLRITVPTNNPVGLTAHGLSPENISQVQQHVLCDICTMLIWFTSNNEAPKDLTATGSLKLQDNLNRLQK